jgi:hypothetical protein
MYKNKEGGLAELVACPPTILKVGGLNPGTKKYFLRKIA